jgi:hypothetical protein
MTAFYIIIYLICAFMSVRLVMKEPHLVTNSFDMVIAGLLGFVWPIWVPMFLISYLVKKTL